MSVVVSGVAACGGSKTSGPVTAAADIGPSGGTFHLADQATVVVPRGALTTHETLTISVAGDAPSGYRNATPVYRFGPSGLKFAVPVQVTLSVREGTVAPVVFWSRESGPGYDVVGGTQAGGMITAAVSHFSTGFVAERKANDGAAPEVDADDDASSAADAGGEAPAPVSDGGAADAGDASGTPDASGTVDASGTPDANDASVAPEAPVADAAVDGGAAAHFVLANIRAGNYTASSPMPFVCDVNGDGKSDIVLTYSNAVWLGHGDGTFDEVPAPALDSQNYPVGTGDFDGDAYCDLLYLVSAPSAPSLGQVPVVFHGRAAGTLAPYASSDARRLVKTDLPFSPGGTGAIVRAGGGALASALFVRTNDQGLADFLIVTGQPPTAGRELAVTEKLGPTLANVQSLRAPVDADKDGKADVLVGSLDGAYLLYGDAQGSFGTTRKTLVFGGGQALVQAFADFDGDGYPDAVVKHQGDPVPLSTIVWGNADGSFTADSGPMILPPAAVADFDGDGRADILNSQLLYGQPGHRFATVKLPAAGGSPLALGDIDGDGTTDLVLTQHNVGADGGAYDLVPIYLSAAKHAIVPVPTFQSQLGPGLFPSSF